MYSPLHRSLLHAPIVCHINPDTQPHTTFLEHTFWYYICIFACSPSVIHTHFWICFLVLYACYISLHCNFIRLSWWLRQQVLLKRRCSIIYSHRCENPISRFMRLIHVINWRITTLAEYGCFEGLWLIDGPTTWGLMPSYGVTGVLFHSWYSFGYKRYSLLL